MKYLSIDTETTGLPECKEAQILEFAAVLDDLKKPQPLDKLPTFHCYIKNDVIRGQAYALQMNHEIIRRIALEEEGYLYLRPEEVGPALKAWLEANTFNRKCDHAKNSEAVIANVAGKNFSSFDKLFIDRLPEFEQHVTFSGRVIDPAVYYMLVDDFRVPDMQTCMNRAKIKETVSHTATEDAKVVIQLIRRAMKVLPQTTGTLEE